MSAGSAFAVYVAGRRYRSVFSAGTESGVSSVSLFKALKASGGEPTVVRGRFVATVEWAERRVSALEDARKRGTAENHKRDCVS